MKKESLRNEFRAICRAIRAGAILRREAREQLRKDAGIILAHEAQAMKNNRKAFPYCGR